MKISRIYWTLLALSLGLRLGVGHAWGAEAPAAAAESPIRAPLSQLLSRLDEEPLAVLALPNLRECAEQMAGTHLAQLLADPRFSEGRAALLARLSELAGTDLDAFWGSLGPARDGPAALCLTRSAAPAGTPDPGFKLTLLLAAPTAQAAQNVQAGWPHPAPQSDTLFSVLGLKTVELGSPETWKEPAAWAAALARVPALGRLSFQPGRLAAAFKTWSQTEGRKEEALELAALEERVGKAVERLTWDLGVDGPAFVERVRLDLGAEGTGVFARMLRSLRAAPLSWDALQAVLPGGQDVSLLMQFDPANLGPDWPMGLHLLECMLRGKKWTRTAGGGEEALAKDRFDFLTGFYGGLVGLVGHPSISGEIHLVTAASSREKDVEVLRKDLMEKLARMDANFQTLEQAGRIGEHAPLAAQFKGRGVLPAPMIGLSEGWVWLCSSTLAYHQVVLALKTGKTATQDPDGSALQTPGMAGFAPPRPSAFRLRVNLETFFPVVYTMWWLAEGGPHLGGWKVPEDCLPSPALFVKRLGVFQAELARTDTRILGQARGPLPSGLPMLIVVLENMADQVENAKAQRASAVREQLERLNAAPAQGSPGGSSDAPAVSP